MVEPTSLDVHFVSVGGLGGIADTCRLYRSLNIPVCIIADLDLLNQLATFKHILLALTAEQQSTCIYNQCVELVNAIKSLGPTITVEVFRNQLQKMLAVDFRWNDASNLKIMRDTLRNVIDAMSPVTRFKHGVESFKANDGIYQTLKVLLNECRAFGLFLVPVGELEGWIPNLMINPSSKRKKAEWANATANQLRTEHFVQFNILLLK